MTWLDRAWAKVRRGPSQGGAADNHTVGTRLIDLWDQYLADPDSVDDSRLAPLLTDTADPVSAIRVFGTLPGGTEMAARVDELAARTIFNGLYHLPDPARQESAVVLVDRARAQTEEIATYLAAQNRVDAADALRQSPIRTMTGQQEFHETVNANRARLNEAFDLVTDDFIDATFRTDPRLFGASKVILHMTMYPGVTNHILNAAIGFPVTFRPTFDLFIGGGGPMAYFDDEILLCLPSA